MKFRKRIFSCDMTDIYTIFDKIPFYTYANNKMDIIYLYTYINDKLRQNKDVMNLMTNKDNMYDDLEYIAISSANLLTCLISLFSIKYNFLSLDNVLNIDIYCAHENPISIAPIYKQLESAKHNYYHHYLYRTLEDIIRFMKHIPFITLTTKHNEIYIARNTNTHLYKKNSKEYWQFFSNDIMKNNNIDDAIIEFEYYTSHNIPINRYVTIDIETDSIIVYNNSNNIRYKNALINFYKKKED